MGDASHIDRRSLPVLLLMTVLVTLWGVGHRFYEILLPAFAEAFALTGTGLALTKGAYQIVYVAGALPAAFLARAFGYKTALQIGLGSICVGAFTFYPATETQGFAVFLLAVLLLAFGWIVLEVAANTLIVRLGPLHSAVRRLNLAQCAYPIGSLIGILTGQWLLQADLVLPQERFVYAIVHPYIGLALGVLVIAFLLHEIEFPRLVRERAENNTPLLRDASQLLQSTPFRFAMAAQFAAILALVVAWNLADIFFHAGFSRLGQHHPGDLLLWGAGAFALGRIAATALMWIILPAYVLEIFAIGAACAALMAAATGGAPAAFACLAMGFFLGPLWPTILGIALSSAGGRLKLATGLITMTGALGAVVAHFLEDLPARPLMLLPALCCAFIALYATYASAKLPAPSANDGTEALMAENSSEQFDDTR